MELKCSIETWKHDWIGLSYFSRVEEGDYREQGKEFNDFRRIEQEPVWG